MPLLLVVRFLFSLLSLLILGVAAYLLWQWWDGDVVREADGDLVRLRDDVLLWTGLALLAFSFLGRPLITPLLARRDTDPTTPQRHGGQVVQGASGAQLYVETLGPPGAPPLVLTHGWAMDSTIWFYSKRDLQKTFRLLCWDLPGMGRSKPATPGAIGLSEFARDLQSIVQMAGQPVVLVGHSIGGMTIQTLARDYPEFFRQHVAGVVLVNTTYTNPLKTMILPRLAQAIRWPLLEPVMRLGIWLQPLIWLGAWQSYLSGTAHMANRLGFGKNVTRSQLEHTTLLATRNPPGNVNRGNLAMFRWDATGALRDINVPVLVLSGAADIVTKPEASEAIASQRAGIRHERFEGANHMGFMERHADYNQAIADFARSVQRVTPPSAIPGAATSSLNSALGGKI
jgi:pimeloyl-ACP methyl ester carboxylesterase